MAGRLIAFNSSGDQRMLDRRDYTTPLSETKPKYVKLMNYNRVLNYIFKADGIGAFLADLDCYNSENPSEEERRWISGWGISQRWGVDKRIIADKILSGELNAYEPDTLEMVDVSEGCEKQGEDPAGPQDYPRALPDRVFELLFKRTEIEAWEASRKPASPNAEPTQISPTQTLTAVQQDIATQKIEPQRQPAQQERVTPEQMKAVNFFAQESGGLWYIGFEGQTTRIKHLDGIQYIAIILLQKPGISISCRELYQAASAKAPDNIMSEEEAIGEGLNIGGSKQAIGAAKARKICREKYKELQERFPDAGVEEQEDIKEKIDALMPYLNLKERNFADPNDKKAQVNIRKRLNTAYKAIGKNKSMKGLEKHLRSYIKSDDAYGQIYTGTITWDITL